MCNNVILILYHRTNNIFNMLKKKNHPKKSSKREKITFVIWELASRRQPPAYFSKTVMDLACTPQLSYSA